MGSISRECALEQEHTGEEIVERRVGANKAVPFANDPNSSDGPPNCAFAPLPSITCCAQPRPLMALKRTRRVYSSAWSSPTCEYS